MVRSVQYLIFVSVLFSLTLFSNLGATQLILSGDEISSPIILSSAIVINSDSLFSSGILLVRGIDYRYDNDNNSFYLTDSAEHKLTDTLIVKYLPLPGFASKRYGRALPSAQSSTRYIPDRVGAPGYTSVGHSFSRVKISGAKSVRLNARTSGESDFGQSLDLSINGQLSDSVFITGSISDRGYDPIRGIANSQVSELDRVHMRITSPHVKASIGDIRTTVNPFVTRQRDITGAVMNFEYPTWNMNLVFGRPKGQFKHVELSGQQNFQGPYQIGLGSAVSPIVPGSESVWLDGDKLEEGADKDYVLDYPLGRISFNAGHPIDARSRIEIDYEPRTTDYREELASVGGGGHFGDSLFYFNIGMQHEGDDRNRLLLGELSASEVTLLELSGDSPAIRSGVTSDTAGSYIVDSLFLPDTVFKYVGALAGGFRVSFSFVGAGNGSYRFAGSEVYQYVGVGQADYLPVVVVPAAERVRDAAVLLGSKTDLLGDITLDFRATETDRNLFSDLDDDDNVGHYYDLKSSKVWRMNSKPGRIELRRRMREVEFSPTGRINSPDFNRRYFYPVNFLPTEDELLHNILLEVSPVNKVSLTAQLSELGYSSQFSSKLSRATITVEPSGKFKSMVGLSNVKTKLKADSVGGDGEVLTFDAAAWYKPFGRYRIHTDFQADRRENEYSPSRTGTRYKRFQSGVSSNKESISYEYYVEDSLSAGWERSLLRHRVRGTSRRTIGRVSIDMSTAYQWLEDSFGRQESILGRAGLRYRDFARALAITSSYDLSSEQRNARGISFIQVEQGRGQFRFEDGEYLPDPDGDFIKIDEILSERASVRRSHKSFSFSKDFSGAAVRFYSDIEEELLPEGEKDWRWLLPFFSDENQPYLFYRSDHQLDLSFIRIGRFHLFNFELRRELETRSASGGEQRRRELNGALELRESLGNMYLSQRVELFDNERGSLFSASGDVNGYELGAEAKFTLDKSELSLGAGYRNASSDKNEKSRQYMIEAGGRLSLLATGELRLKTTAYTQKLSGLIGAASYQLTDNLYGAQGIHWDLSVNYGLYGNTRINATLNGRHSDDRTARIFMHGEVVTKF